jgi:dTDP-4-dehydrorhamnose reductase
MDISVLVTGASGLLGRAILSFLKEKGYRNATGTALSRTGPGLHRLDLTDALAVAAFVAEHKPRVVVHAAAQRFVDKVAADPDAASKINVEATKALANSVSKYTSLV